MRPSDALFDDTARKVLVTDSEDRRRHFRKDKALDIAAQRYYSSLPEMHQQLLQMMAEDEGLSVVRLISKVWERAIVVFHDRMLAQTHTGQTVMPQRRREDGASRLGSE
jgi:hypothetical protein